MWFHIVDDDLAFGLRATEVGNDAIGLWVRAGAWCAGNSTNGFIPDEVAKQLGPRTIRNDLVKARLFDQVPGGYQFRDWYARHLSLIRGGQA
jgi:hypothetical protein